MRSAALCSAPRQKRRKKLRLILRGLHALYLIIFYQPVQINFINGFLNGEQALLFFWSMPMSLTRFTIICGGHVLDPINGLDSPMDILIDKGRIISVSKPGNGDLPPKPHTLIDASGLLVVPGLVDMHVHLREPGQEYKETIATGALAAAHGGFTSVACMPNTDPVNDHVNVIAHILEKAKETGAAKVYPVCAITRGLLGEELCDFEELARAGAVAFSDDGMPVIDSGIMLKALELAKSQAMPVLSHCEELSLSGGGVMNPGPVAKRLGLAGIPNCVESIMVQRDIALCRLSDARLHICHVSTAESVDAIRKAKADGVLVTAETAPHYFTLTDKAVAKHGANAKMNPPLRSLKDRDAIRQGLSDNTIDVIATDHAPHSPKEKQVEFNLAPNGVVGLETSLSLSLALVKAGVLTLSQLVMKMSVNPARILGLDFSGICSGKTADITIIDTKKAVIVDPARFCSKSVNTPFKGMALLGAPVLTMVEGRIIYSSLD